MSLGVVVLAVGSTKPDDLRPFSPEIAAAIADVRPGEVAYVEKN